MTTYNTVPSQPLQPFLPPLLPKKPVWGAWPTFGFTLVILAAFFIAQTIVIIIPVFGSLFQNLGAGFSPDELAELLMDDLNSQLGFLQSIATIVSGAIGTGLILIFIRANKGANIAEYLGLRKISIKWALASAGITIAYLVLASLIETALGVQSDETIVNQIYDTSISPVLFGVAVVIFAPLFEEALFRGFLFEGLRQSWWGVYGAIMLTSFGWAMLHGLQYNLSGILYIFFLGIIMGVIRWKSKTIWSTFIMHAIVNLVATLSLATNWGF